MNRQPNRNTLEGHRRHLRERFLKHGLRGFADYEKVELLLTLCLPRRDVKPLAKALLTRFGHLKAILEATAEELQTIPGIGEVAPIALQIIRQSLELYLEECAENKIVLDNSSALEHYWRIRFKGIRKECFEIALLDNRLQLLKNGIYSLEEGTVDRVVVWPRKIMEMALQRGASAFIMVHNHPSGDPSPSDQDYFLTQKILEAAESLEMRCIDHLIFGTTRCYSMRQNHQQKLQFH
ncbi:MAG: DNA repair protein RadC [Puniceicoccales bacterium]|jgi:DNA repair protein RadC|nr:DNA repair protein RadC [Puniceicoccales bacterium]